MTKGKVKATEDAPLHVQLRPVEKRLLSVRIEGVEPLVQHKWSEKARKQIRDKKLGLQPKGVRVREVCDPEQECKDATYFLSDGSYALDVTAVKKAVIGAAHRDYGLPKTVVAQSMFFKGEEGRLVRLITTGYKMREDMVRVGNGQADLRWRPEFKEWAVDLLIEYYTERINPDLIVNLLERAGGQIGIGEGRPEKQSGLDWGRFTVKSSKEAKD